MNKRMWLAYVAGPYRDKRGEHYVVQNIRKAEAVALELWKLGFSVICPHKNTALFGGTMPDEVWLDGDFEIIRRCDILVLCEGSHLSQGANAELKLAMEIGLPVYHWPRDQRAIAELGSIRRENLPARMTA